jgi:hypothetical protein
MNDIVLATVPVGIVITPELRSAIANEHLRLKRTLSADEVLDLEREIERARER